MVYRYWDNRPVTFYPNLSNRAVTGSYDTYFKTNTLGFNDIEHKFIKEENVFRILLLGDSYVEAVGVDPTKHIARNLEKLFKNSQKNVEVISMGMSGWGTAHQIATYEKVGRNFKPDLVISFFCSNDLHDNNKNQNTTKSNPPNRIYTIIDNKLTLGLQTNETPLTIKQKILRKLNIFETYHVLRYFQKIFYYHFLIPKEDVKIANLINAEKIEKELTIDDWASKEDFDFFYLILEKMKEEITLNDNADLISVIVSGGINENMDKSYFEYLKKVQKTFEDYDIKSINFDKIFRESYLENGILPHWESDAHWNETGHKLVAEILFNYIKESINN